MSHTLQARAPGEVLWHLAQQEESGFDLQAHGESSCRRILQPERFAHAVTIAISQEACVEEITKYINGPKRPPRKQVGGHISPYAYPRKRARTHTSTL